MTDLYQPCFERDCGHPAEAHPLVREGDLPDVLCDCPCTVPGCRCTDYDGMLHPERPSLADAWISRGEDGGIVVGTEEPRDG